jgi:hypothetical protein
MVGFGILERFIKAIQREKRTCWLVVGWDSLRCLGEDFVQLQEPIKYFSLQQGTQTLMELSCASLAYQEIE